MMRKAVSAFVSFTVVILGFAIESPLSLAQPQQCVAMFLCTIIVTQPCSNAFFDRSCVDPRSWVFARFTECTIGAAVGNCLAAVPETVQVNTIFFGAQGAPSGFNSACTIPGTTIVCWKKRPCTECEVRFIGGIAKEVCVSSANYVNLEAYTDLAGQGSCDNGGGGGLEP